MALWAFVVMPWRHCHSFKWSHNYLLLMLFVRIFYFCILHCFFAFSKFSIADIGCASLQYSLKKLSLWFCTCKVKNTDPITWFVSWQVFEMSVRIEIKCVWSACIVCLKSSWTMFFQNNFWWKEALICLFETKCSLTWIPS